MATLTINEKEYNTDDFNEEQQKIYQEIQFASAEMDRISYTLRVLDVRRQQLAALIEQMANQEEVKQLPDGQDKDE